MTQRKSTGFKYPDGTYIARDECPVKYPNFYEALQDAINLWDDACTATFCVVIDHVSFFKRENFERKLWYFEDDGKTLRAYSGIRGLRRLLEFADNSWKDGRIRAEK